MKKLVLFTIVAIALIAFTVRAQGAYEYSATVAPETFDKTYTRDISSLTWFKNCDVEANFNSGMCQYLDFCYAVLPKTAISINDAVKKDCVKITQISSPTSIRVLFNTIRGMRYAVVTFISVTNKTAIYTTSPSGQQVFSGNWNVKITYPEAYKQIEEVIGMCNPGYMLRANTCFPAQGICLDQYSTNMCTNQYDMYCLAYRYKCLEGNIVNQPSNCPLPLNATPYYECEAHTDYACADRDKNSMCDTVVSTICPDINNNGICDADDTLIAISCIDANHNGICDDVETTGVFCPKAFAPVCVGGAGGKTYPNSCFAEAAGYTTYTQGECDPANIVRQCQSNSECPIPVECQLHLTATCINYICNYQGQCGQCNQASDCPLAPCVGVSQECSTLGICSYAGKCITQPKEEDPWAAFWAEFWAWILGQMGWL